MKVEDNALETIEKKSLKWLGLVLRMDYEIWQKVFYHWKPDGRRKGGK